MATDSLFEQIAAEGCSLLPAVFSPDEADALRDELTAALAQASGSVMQSDAGSIYAARNILSLWPRAAVIWHQPVLLEALAAVLGQGFGLVRTLYFDKPPERTWALPWHKDLTIAVKDNRLPTRHFGKPTRKAGVPHVEASAAVLQRMLFARIHLDDVTEANGPLQVVPGSQRDGKEMKLGQSPPRSILARRGDVLLIRPLVAHASSKSHPDTQRHRRILHLEFAAASELPDGYEWHEFVPARG